MSGSSQFTQAPNLNEFTADHVLFQAGRQTQGVPSSIFKPMGVLYTTSAIVSLAAGTAEQTLATFSLPPLSLDRAGRKLFVRAQFSVANNAHSKTCNLYFGSVEFTTGAVSTASANLNPYLEMWVTQGADASAASPNVQVISVAGVGGTTGIVPVTDHTQASESVSAAIVIKATGQTGTSNVGDIQLLDFFVQYMN